MTEHQERLAKATSNGRSTEGGPAARGLAWSVWSSGASMDLKLIFVEFPAVFGHTRM